MDAICRVPSRVTQKILAVRLIVVLTLQCFKPEFFLHLYLLFYCKYYGQAAAIAIFRQTYVGITTTSTSTP